MFLRFEKKKKIQKEKICSHKNDEFKNEKPVRTTGSLTVFPSSNFNCRLFSQVSRFQIHHIYENVSFLSVSFFSTSQHKSSNIFLVRVLGHHSRRPLGERCTITMVILERKMIQGKLSSYGAYRRYDVHCHILNLLETFFEHTDN